LGAGRGSAQCGAVAVSVEVSCFVSS
jgi:hypothetical protein